MEIKDNMLRTYTQSKHTYTPHINIHECTHTHRNCAKSDHNAKAKNATNTHTK